MKKLENLNKILNTKTKLKIIQLLMIEKEK